METPPPRLWSLTEYQARTLREAVDAGPDGLYVPHTSRGESMYELVAGGAAEYREEHRVGEATRGVHDPRPCEWTDWYIVATPWGLELLARAERGA